ncbi:MAG: hypothetical protein R3F19_01400 [Verrucomicrobiales bacterium]|nr:hypothetical protein [Verrucomicrobiae bacterium]
MKFLLYAVSILVMSLTVPWFFSTEPGDAMNAPDAGLPLWVIYNIGASIFYAALVAALIHWAWNASAGAPEEETTSGGAGQ